MSEMKLIMERWDGYLDEAEEGPTAGLTWAQLDGAVKAAAEMKQTQLSKERQAELLKVLGEEAFKLALSFTGPLAGLLGAAHTVGSAISSMFKAYAKEPDTETVDNPLLAALNLSDGFEELIDDRLEDAFIEEMMPEIEKQAEAAPDTPIPNMDGVIKNWLAAKKIGGTTGNTVAKVAENK